MALKTSLTECKKTQNSTCRRLPFLPTVHILSFTFAAVLSVNRPAYQISDYQSSTASRAVDGNYSTVSCTLTTTGPWWAVELYQQSHVGALIVTNDINPDRGQYFYATSVVILAPESKNPNRRILILWFSLELNGT